MQVRCESDHADKLSDAHWVLGYTKQSRFDLTVGRTYTAYAVCLWGSVLHYLVLSEMGGPNWYPADLFRVVCGKLPRSWVFAYTNAPEDVQVRAVFGYRELVEAETHFDELSEKTPEALGVFFKRKLQIDGEGCGSDG